MSGWSDWIFGNLPPMPARPSSRGALLGARYQGMPDAKASITDRRQDFPYAGLMQNAPGVVGNSPYSAQPVSMPGDGSGSDPMMLAANTLDPNQPSDVAPYTPSFQQNWRPPPTGQAPYRPSPVGPNLPRGPVGSSFDPEMPYAGAHLPISPGDPGWTPPPSPSGPHNRQGDPARPGYDRPGFSMGAASQFTPQQLQSALQYWGGWQ